MTVPDWVDKRIRLRPDQRPAWRLLKKLLIEEDTDPDTRESIARSPYDPPDDLTTTARKPQ